MKTKLIIVSIAIVALGVFAAEKTGVFTRTTTITEVKKLVDAHANYDELGNLTTIVVRWDSVKMDGGGVVGTYRGSDTWTLDKINALQDVVAGETNKFKTKLQSDWIKFDGLAEDYVTGWKTPAWMVP